MIQSFLGSGFGKAFTLFILIALFFSVLFWLFRPFLVPLLLAMIAYSLLETFVSRLCGYGIKKSLSVAIVLMAVILLTMVLLVIVVPIMLEQLQQFKSNMPHLWKQLSDVNTAFNQWVNHNLGKQINAEELSRHWFQNIESWGASAIVSSASVLIDMTLALLLVPLITFFLLRDYRIARNNFIAWLPNRYFELGWLIYYRVSNQLQHYIRGVLIQSSTIAVITALGFTLVGLEMALLFGVIAGLLNVIPYIGPLLACVPPVISMVASNSFDAWNFFGIIGVLVFAQFIDNLIVMPSVIAHSVGIHPLVVVFSVMIFGYLFGFVGMLLAIPIIAAAKILFLGLLHGLDGAAYSQVKNLT